MKRFFLFVLVLFSLFAFISCDGGVQREETKETEPHLILQPIENTPYLFGIRHNIFGSIMYFDGTLDGGYLGVTLNRQEAVPIEIEKIDDGYRLFFYQEKTKKYIECRLDGKLRKFFFTEIPSIVYHYDSKLLTFIFELEEKEYWIGSYSCYDTLAASEIDYITGDREKNIGISQFVARIDLTSSINAFYGYPDEQVYIEDNCFRTIDFINQEGYPNSCVIPEGYKILGSHALRNCRELNCLEIPNTIIEIRDHALRSCTSLETIVFKGTVAQWNEIDRNPYWNGESIKTIICSDGEITL